MQHRRYAGARQLPGGLAAREPAADDVHRAIVAVHRTNR
jgi:hypothetical protein